MVLNISDPDTITVFFLEPGIQMDKITYNQNSKLYKERFLILKHIVPAYYMLHIKITFHQKVIILREFLNHYINFAYYQCFQWFIRLLTSHYFHL